MPTQRIQCGTAMTYKPIGRNETKNSTSNIVLLPLMDAMTVSTPIRIIRNTTSILAGENENGDAGSHSAAIHNRQDNEPATTPTRRPVFNASWLRIFANKSMPPELVVLHMFEPVTVPCVRYTF